MTYDLPRWTAIQVKPRSETRVQRDIEDQGIGTCLPSFCVTDGRRRRFQALLPGYIFAAGAVDRDTSEGIIGTVGPIRDGELQSMMLAHVMRAHDRYRPRSANGSFARKQRKRRRRPRHGRRHVGGR